MVEKRKWSLLALCSALLLVGSRLRTRYLRLRVAFLLFNRAGVVFWPG